MNSLPGRVPQARLGYAQTTWGFGGFRDRDAHAFNVTLYPLSYEAKTGGPGECRNLDLRIASAELCQLSYRPTKLEGKEEVESSKT